MIHDMYLMRVKSPDKSTEPWDYYNIVETFKGETAWTTRPDPAPLEVTAAAGEPNGNLRPAAAGLPRPASWGW